MFAALVWDTITKPAETLRFVAQEKKIIPAAGVILIAWLLEILSEFALPSNALSGLAGQGTAQTSTLTGPGDPTVLRIVLLAAIPGGWLLASALFFAVGKAFNSKGSFVGLLAALGFAQSPGLISIAAVSVFQLLGDPGICLGVIASLALAFWVMLLQVTAIREGLALTAGRAVATWLLSLVALFVLVVFVSFVYVIVTMLVTS